MRTMHDFEILELPRKLNGNAAKYNQLTYRQKKVKLNDDPSKEKHTYKHFFKQNSGLHNTPAREVALMEFFRLLVPRQPKYRYYAEIINGQKIEYVQSKEIQNHRKFQDPNPNHKGLMEVGFIGISILMDGDSVTHNYLEDHEDFVYRIDGGLAGMFGDINESTKLGIIPDHIIRDYPEDTQMELYTVLLKFLVCTDFLIDAWAHHYQPKNSLYSKYTDIISDALALKRIRQNMLNYLSYPGIKAFILSDKASEIYAQHRQHVEGFCVKGKQKLLTDTHILDSMDIQFEFLKNLAKMDEYADNVLIHKTNPQAQVDALLKHTGLLKKDLEELQKTYTQTNSLMSHLIRQLIDKTHNYNITLTENLKKFSAYELQKKLEPNHRQFTKDLEKIINDQQFAQLLQPNHIGYWIHCLFIFLIRSFLRLFDIIFHYGNTLNSRPQYRPVFFYPQTSLKPEIDKMKTDIDAHLLNCEKIIQVK